MDKSHSRQYATGQDLIVEPDGLWLLLAAMYGIIKTMQRKGHETKFIREQKKTYFSLVRT